MVQFAIGGDTKFQTRELGGIQIKGNHPRRPASEHGQSIVTRRSNGKTDVARPNLQTGQEHISVFPTLRVANAGKIGARRRLAESFSRHWNGNRASATWP